MSTAEALRNIHPQLHTFFVPQIEQMHMNLHEHCGGAFGSVDADNADLGCGQFFALELGPSCLLTSHQMRANRDFPLEEETTRSLCVGSFTSAGATLCPTFASDLNAFNPEALKPRENIVVFNQENKRSISPLQAGQVFDSVSLCILPPYFKNLETTFGPAVARQAQALMEAGGFVLSDETAPYIRAALRSLSSVNVSVGIKRAHMRKVERLVALLAVHETENKRAQQLRGARSHAQLVRHLQLLIQADPAHPPTLNELTEAFHISRARLCAIFKAEAGESIGAYTARVRINFACQLLEDPTLSIASVAAAAGYTHQSSFTDAFKRSTGKTPQEWRGQYAGEELPLQ